MIKRLRRVREQELYVADIGRSRRDQAVENFTELRNLMDFHDYLVGNAVAGELWLGTGLLRRINRLDRELGSVSV